MQNIDAEKSLTPTFEEIGTLLFELFKIPSFSELKTNSNPSEVFHLFSRLYNKFDLNFQIEENLTPLQYDHHINTLKSKLFENLLLFHPKKPAFLIINELNNRLEIKNLELCDRIMIELVTKMKEDELKKEVRQHLSAVFAKYDVSGDGIICMNELEHTFSILGLPNNMAKEIMENADTKRDGYISFEEFEEYFEQRVLKNYKLFYNLDFDGDKNLNYYQVRQVLNEIYPNLNMTDEQYALLFQTIDQDQTGLVDLREFCEFLLMFPRKNLDCILEKWKLFSFTSLDPQELSSPFLEEDLMEVRNKSYSNWDLLKTLFCGGLSGAVSRTITAPLERLKVFYQTMYQDSNPPSTFKGLKDVYKEKGLYALFRGNSVSISMAIIEQSLRFGVMEYSIKHYENQMDFKKNYILVSLFTSILSSLIIFPMEVVRVRVILSSEEPSRIVLNKIKQISSRNGIQGFYTGIVPHMISVLPSGALNLFFYNVLRKYYVYDSDVINPKVSKFMMIGGISGLITGTITYPFNLLTSRIITAKKIKNDVNMFGIIKQTFKNEGTLGFFKGYQASIMRVIIGQACNFGIYEWFKSAVNIGSH